MSEDRWSHSVCIMLLLSRNLKIHIYHIQISSFSDLTIYIATHHNDVTGYVFLLLYSYTVKSLQSCLILLMIAMTSDFIKPMVNSNEIGKSDTKPYT